MGEAFFWIWLAIAIITIIIEIATNELRSFWFTIGSLSSLTVNLINKNAYLTQILVFIIVSVTSVIYLRPIAQKYIGDTKINADSLVGKTVTIVNEITKEKKGTVKFDNLYFKGKSMKESFSSGEKAIIYAVKKGTIYIKKDHSHQN